MDFLLMSLIVVVVAVIAWEIAPLFLLALMYGVIWTGRLALGVLALGAIAALVAGSGVVLATLMTGG